MKKQSITMERKWPSLDETNEIEQQVIEKHRDELVKVRCKPGRHIDTIISNSSPKSYFRIKWVVEKLCNKSNLSGD